MNDSLLPDQREEKQPHAFTHTDTHERVVMATYENPTGLDEPMEFSTEKLKKLFGTNKQ